MPAERRRHLGVFSSTAGNRKHDVSIDYRIGSAVELPFDDSPLTLLRFHELRTSRETDPF